MFDIITIGSATRDVFLDVSFLKKEQEYLHVECGKKFDIPRPFTQTGGGATNTAVAFARLGLKTSILSKIGQDDAGHNVLRTLRREGIDSTLINEDSNLGTALSVILTKKGADRTIFTYRGASEEIEFKKEDLQKLKTKWIYITGLRGSSLSVLKVILTYAKKEKIKVAMNPGSKELEMPEILKQADVLILNKEEAEQVAKTKGETETILRTLIKKYNSIIAITDGKKKIYVAENKKIYSTYPYDVKIKNTLGAGDAFGAGFVAALIRKKSTKEAIKWGCLNASSVIQHTGAKIGLLYTQDQANYEKSLQQKLGIRETPA